MSDSMDNSMSVPQLTATNYGVWKNRVIRAIGSKSAEAALVLQGKIPLPPNDAKSDAFIQWSRQDFIAMNIISRSLSDTVIQSMEEHNTSHALWNALKDRYEMIDHSQLLAMQRDFMLLKQGRSQPFEAFLDQILSKQSRIAATGHPLTDDQVLQVLIHGLNSNFMVWIPTLASNLNDAITQGIQGPVILNKLIGIIRNADQLVNSGKQLSVSHQSETAMPTHHHHSSGRPYCNFCKRPGHADNTCFANPASPAYKGSAEKAKSEAIRLAQQKQGKRPQKAKSAKGEFKALSEEKGMVVALATPNTSYASMWLADSGASSHMTFDAKDLSDLDETFTGFVTVGGNVQLPITGKGKCHLNAIVNGEKVTRTLLDVLLIPELGFRLFSVESTISRGFQPLYDQDGLRIIDPASKAVMLESVKQGKARYLLTEESEHALVTTKPITPPLQLWHQRLGHIAEKAVKLTLNQASYTQDAPPSNGNICLDCQVGGQVRHSFSTRDGAKASQTLALVHTDVVGPLPLSLSKKAYFVTFIDNKTGYVNLFTMATKNEVNCHFQTYLAQAERSTGKLLKALRSDGGGEYINQDMEKFLSSKGIERHVTMPRSPQQNGVAERLNRTLMEMVRSMASKSSAPPSLWAEALNLAVWIHNRVPRGKRTSPYQAWFKHLPNLSILRTFGCLAYAADTTQKKKLEDRSIPLTFIGFAAGRKGWKLLNQSTGRITFSIDVVFDESFFPFKSSGSSSGEGDWTQARLAPLIKDRTFTVSDSEDSDNDTPPTQDHQSDGSSDLSDPPSDTEEEVLTQATINSSRPQRAHQAPSRLQDYHLAGFIAHAFVASTADMQVAEEIPLTINQARSLDTWPDWKNAIEKEESNHKENGTWTLCTLPKGRTAIGNRWVFNIKHNPDGSIDKFKARLVAKGYSQKEGIDFKETFSPVVRSGTIRLVLSIAAMYDWPIHQADVIAAYLNGYLTEDIYMVQPPGLEDGTDRVCKLVKGLYGLKQSGRVWYQSAHDQLIKMNFRCVESDQGLYVKGGLDQPLSAIICLYVDDMIITASTLEQVQQIKDDFHRQFKIVDGGPVSYILGLQVSHDSQYLEISQASYIKKIVERYGLAKSAPVATPLPLNFNMEEADKAPALPPSLKLVYQSIIGAVMYAAMGTRVDIAFTAQLLSRKLQSPTSGHLIMAKHLLRYLNSTAAYSLKYHIGINRDSNGQLVTYCDADYAGDKATARSTGGVLTTFNSGIITWMSRRQDCVATSSLESEYIVLCDGAKETAWMRRLLEHFGLKPSGPTTIHADNQGANAYAKDTQFHRRTKHINVRYHYTRDQIKDSILTIEYIPTALQKADILTKPLLNVKHLTAVKQLGLPSRAAIEREC
ncbi:hypothetical protein CBS101457_006769 [Exobasidium rhododendri]|nr:hypothetical protein CBS101457_006769 [Exobasidium rhododendri]